MGRFGAGKCMGMVGWSVQGIAKFVSACSKSQWVYEVYSKGSWMAKRAETTPSFQNMLAHL